MDASLISVACDSTRPEERARADALAARLGLPRRDVDADTPLVLVVTDERLEVRQTDSVSGPVFAEFIGGPFGQRKTQSLRRELVARAVGFKGPPLEVIDMTAGLGRDAMVLALLGCHVTAIESNPIVLALFEDGLRRARLDPELARAVDSCLRLVAGDSEHELAALASEAPPDVVYLDPMFPERGQSAAAKKEMVLLSRLVGGEDDAERLLVAAVRGRAHRVVLKRPRHSAVLEVPGAPPPDLRFEGRAARFDVYFPAVQASQRPA